MKTELFQLVSDSLISQCNQEETDTRLFIHANHAAWNGLCKITIAAHDTDVMVIALYTFAALRLVKFWIEYVSARITAATNSSICSKSGGTKCAVLCRIGTHQLCGILCLPLLEEIKNSMGHMESIP